MAAEFNPRRIVVTGERYWQRLSAAASGQSRRQVGRSSPCGGDRQGYGLCAGIGVTPINFPSPRQWEIGGIVAIGASLYLQSRQMKYVFGNTEVFLVQFRLLAVY